MNHHDIATYSEWFSILVDMRDDGFAVDFGRDNLLVGANGHVDDADDNLLPEVYLA